MERKINNDNSLLALEKKLNNGSTDEIILNKFKLKPNFNVQEATRGKEYINGLNSFLNNFKQSTEELINNPELIEEKNIESKIKSDIGMDKTKKFIKMDLALGVLDMKNKNENENENEDKKVDLLKKIIKEKNNSNVDSENHPLLNDEADNEILKFLLSNKKKNRVKNGTRRRIHKIKLNNIK